MGWDVSFKTSGSPRALLEFRRARAVRTAPSYRSSITDSAAKVYAEGASVSVESRLHLLEKGGGGGLDLGKESKELRPYGVRVTWQDRQARAPLEGAVKSLRDDLWLTMLSPRAEREKSAT